MKSISLSILLLFIIGLTITFAGDGSGLKIEYQVECENCDVSFKNEFGQTVNADRQLNKWSYSFSGAEGQFIYVAARSWNTGKVVLRIVKNGVVSQVAESTDADGFASLGDTL